MPSGTHRLVCAALLLLLLPGSTAVAETEVELSTGQTVYVSVYSNVFHGEKVRAFELAATLNIRNTDRQRSITILAADYFDSDGHKIRSYVKQAERLGALASTYFHIKESNTAGGHGANFIVKWASEQPVNTPIIEAVMVGVHAGQGLSLRTPGKVIKEH